MLDQSQRSTHDVFYQAPFIEALVAVIFPKDLALPGAHSFLPISLAVGYQASGISGTR